MKIDNAGNARFKSLQMDQADETAINMYGKAILNPKLTGNIYIGTKTLDEYIQQVVKTMSISVKPIKVPILAADEVVIDVTAKLS